MVSINLIVKLHRLNALAFFYCTSIYLIARFAESMKNEIDKLNNRLYSDIHNGVCRSRFKTVTYMKAGKAVIHSEMAYYMGLKFG